MGTSMPPSDMNNASVPRVNPSTSSGGGNTPDGSGTSTRGAQGEQSDDKLSSAGQNSNDSSGNKKDNSDNSGSNSDNNSASSSSSSGGKSSSSGESNGDKSDKKKKAGDAAKKSGAGGLVGHEIGKLQAEHQEAKSLKDADVDAALGGEQTAAQQVELDERQNKLNEKRAKRMARLATPVVAKAAAVSVPLAVLYKIINAMRLMLLGLYQMLLHVTAAVSGVLHSIVHAITSFVTGVASFLAIPFSVAAALVGGISGTAVVSVVLAIIMVITSGVPLEGKVVEDCRTHVNEALAQAEQLESSKEAEEREKKVYFALKSMGVPATNIAGVMGCWHCECGFDNTTIECGYDTPVVFLHYGEEEYSVGTKKQQIIADFDTYSDSIGTHANHSAYMASQDHKYYCGFGLCQWTGDSAYTFLSKYAGSKNISMSNLDALLQAALLDFDYQMAYAFTKVPTGRSAYNLSSKASDAYVNQSFASPAAAASDFCYGYEGIHDPDSKRGTAATAYIEKFKQWDTESGLEAQMKSWFSSTIMNIMNLIDTATEVAFGDGVDQQIQNCKKYRYLGFADNSSLASAALSLAHPGGKTSVPHGSVDGTDNYKLVYNAMMGLSGTSCGGKYCDCGHFVRTCLWWSGTDLDAKNWGTTQYMYQSMAASSKWEFFNGWTCKSLSSFTSSDLQKLEDACAKGSVFVFCTKDQGHTFLYVGQQQMDAFREQYKSQYSMEPKPNSCICGASYFQYGGCTQQWWGDGRGYGVFICKTPDGTPQTVDGVASVSSNVSESDPTPSGHSV